MNLRKILNLVLGFILVMSSFSNFAFAATTVTDVYDLPSSLKISQDSNHKFVITLSDAVDEGENLTIIFPSDFDTASITEDDIDISDDGVDLTTAANCSGSEMASVAIASDVVTITICAGDGGAIATSSEVIVEIGANAAASGSGTNKIVNPSSAATYFAGIGGTSGMSGSVPLPIVSDDDSTVSTVVTGNGSGASEGGGGVGDAESGSTEPGTTDEGTTDEGVTDEGTTDEGTTDEGTTDEGTTDEGTTDEGVTDEGTSEGSTTEGSTGESSGESSSSESTSSGTGEGSPSSGADSGTESGGTESGSGESGGLADQTDVEVSIIVAGDEINLGDGTIDVLPGTEALVRVNIDSESEIESVTVVIGDTNYQLLESLSGVYEGLVIVPASDSTATTIVKYVDGTIDTKILGLDTKPSGWVYEVIDGERVPVEGAIVIVYESETVQWPASSYGQSNPISVGSGGAFAWYAPNGDYIVTAGKSGFEDSQVTVRVSRNILTANIELIRSEPEVPIETVSQEPQTRIQATVSQVFESTNEAAQAVIEAINEVRDIPEVQTAADVAKPVTVAAAVGSAGVLTSSFNLFAFIRYLFSSPVLFFARRKRRQFGIVYNAITKIPIDLAIVRLYSESGKLVKTIVTDKEGRYFFKVNPGRYQITVTRREFDFPSGYLKDKKIDGNYLDVYTGGVIEVTDKHVTISANIPLDPSQAEKYHAPKKLIISRFLRVLQHVLAVSGLILAIGVVIIQPSVFSFSLLVVHVVVYAVTRILTSAKKKKGWGIVAASQDGKPIANTVVRLFEPKYNKLIESTLTDGKGRYAFLAGPNEYFVTFDKDGFEHEEVRPIDYTKNNEPKVISVDVKMSQKML